MQDRSTTVYLAVLCAATRMVNHIWNAVGALCSIGLLLMYGLYSHGTLYAALVLKALGRAALLALRSASSADGTSLLGFEVLPVSTGSLLATSARYHLEKHASAKRLLLKTSCFRGACGMSIGSNSIYAATCNGQYVVKAGGRNPVPSLPCYPLLQDCCTVE